MNKIYSVKEIFTSYLHNEGMSQYNRPEYQRGYKWSEQQIIEKHQEKMIYLLENHYKTQPNEN